MYQDKLAQLKKQLQQLKDGTLPEYQKKFKKLEVHYKERVRLNEVWFHYEVFCSVHSFLLVGIQHVFLVSILPMPNCSDYGTCKNMISHRLLFHVLLGVKISSFVFFFIKF